MKCARAIAAASVLFLVSFHLAATWAWPSDSREADSAAIKKLFADFNDAFNDHNASAVAMLFTDDADYIPFQGTMFHGRTEIEQHLAPLFAGRLKTLHREASLRNIRFLHPDMATLVGDWETSGRIGPNGVAAPSTKGLYDWIVMQQNGRWLIAFWHESNLPSPAPPPAQ